MFRKFEECIALSDAGQLHTEGKFWQLEPHFGSLRDLRSQASTELHRMIVLSMKVQQTEIESPDGEITQCVSQYKQLTNQAQLVSTKR